MSLFRCPSSHRVSADARFKLQSTTSHVSLVLNSAPKQCRVSQQASKLNVSPLCINSTGSALFAVQQMTLHTLYLAGFSMSGHHFKRSQNEAARPQSNDTRLTLSRRNELTVPPTTAVGGGGVCSLYGVHSFFTLWTTHVPLIRDTYPLHRIDTAEH